MVTDIFEAKFTGPDRIDVKLVAGKVVTPTLSVSLRDFLHFGHFLVALRAAMNDGHLPDYRIDRARLRESWDPRRDILERKLCDSFSDSK
ncbi:MAG TPA: hypothetical protein VHV08_11830 [Pirellulales bacterium]|jgi:hypothetical protein|nr:hypothetical protein [Pirellulales bacterium]